MSLRSGLVVYARMGKEVDGGGDEQFGGGSLMFVADRTDAR